MNNVVAIPQQNEVELIAVLQTSLYPGASIGSVKMVIGYCKAAGLDPMQKPVHIVPMWDSKAGAMRDVVMPGIGLYRTQAARSGQYAGVTDPEFGPDIEENIGGTKITYPKFCRVAVKRLVGGQIVEFAAVEFWKENYAVRGGKEKSIAPNAMWQKRPYGQIAKCAEAQALRKAFPEFGSEPTADEMEGKEFETHATQAAPAERSLPPYAQDSFEASITKWDSLIQQGKKSAEDIIAAISSKHTLTEGQRAAILALEQPPIIEGEIV